MTASGLSALGRLMGPALNSGLPPGSGSVGFPGLSDGDTITHVLAPDWEST